MIMLLGIAIISISGMILIATERCRRNPQTCRDGFMRKTGYTRSLIALWYFIGKPEEARAAIMNDTKIRRKYIIESYLWSLVGMIAGIVLLLNN